MRPSLPPDRPGPPDIWLITCPFWGVKMPPLGLGYIAAAVHGAGYTCTMIDLNVDCYNLVSHDPEMEILWETNPPGVSAEDATRRVFEATLSRVEEVVGQIRESGSRFVGFSINYRSRDFSNRVIQVLKREAPEVTVIIGGPETFTQHSLGQLAHTKGDVFVIGEGERTLPDVLSALTRGLPLDHMPGVVARKEGIILTAYTPRKPEMRLDKLPWPVYPGLDLAAYTTPRMPMLTSRGCVCHCRFCVDYILNAPYRFRSAQDVVDEMEYNIETHGRGDFAYNDLLCNGNIKVLGQLCDKIIEKDLQVRWDSYAIVRKEMTPELLGKMARAGCHNLCYGTESGSDRVIRLMGKFALADVAATCVRNTHEAGIRTSLNIIVGFPGETEAEFQDTLNFLTDNAEYIDEVTNVSSLVVMPGSYLAKNLEQFGISYISDADSWVDEEGSTPASRGRRVQRVMELIAGRRMGHEILNHSELTEQKVMISVVVPCEGGPPPAQAYADLIGYPFCLTLVGDVPRIIEESNRIRSIPRRPGQSTASCINEAVETGQGLYLALCPPGELVSRRWLFHMYQAMERCPEVHFAYPKDGHGSFMRRAAFVELGGLDESLHHEWWGLDLLVRGHLWGYASASVPWAPSTSDPGTIHPPALAPLSSTHSAEDAFRFVLKNYPRSAAREGVLQLLSGLLPGAGDPLGGLRTLTGYLSAARSLPWLVGERRTIQRFRRISEAEARRVLAALD